MSEKGLLFDLNSDSKGSISSSVRELYSNSTCYGDVLQHEKTKSEMKSLESITLSKSEGLSASELGLEIVATMPLISMLLVHWAQ